MRHDIDFSVNKSLALAQIEPDPEIKSTYYVNPHSEFHNASEKMA